VDLLIDADKAGLRILELKHYDRPYEMSKGESLKLLERRRALEKATHGRRSIFIHLLASNGVVRNKLVDEIVDYVHDVKSLFRASNEGARASALY
jgi:hypothetical protein